MSVWMRITEAPAVSLERMVIWSDDVRVGDYLKQGPGDYARIEHTYWYGVGPDWEVAIYIEGGDPDWPAVSWPTGWEIEIYREGGAHSLPIQ